LDIKQLFRIIAIWLKELRIQHWVKNLFVFAPLLFSGDFTNGLKIEQSIILFVLFCLLSSNVYIVNDLPDLKNDQLRPEGLDSNSTDCLLNTFANQVHIEKHKFDPYAFEIVGMVKTGAMSRKNGLDKIYEAKDYLSSVNLAKNKLGL
jgi:hypothetical protein